jgi:hypothetical protein
LSFLLCCLCCYNFQLASISNTETWLFGWVWTVHGCICTTWRTWLDYNGTSIRSPDGNIASSAMGTQYYHGSSVFCDVWRRRKRYRVTNDDTEERAVPCVSHTLSYCSGRVEIDQHFLFSTFFLRSLRKLPVSIYPRTKRCYVTSMPVQYPTNRNLTYRTVFYRRP